MTGELNLKEVRTDMDAYSQFSGRPNWNRIFKKIAQEKAGTDIGVFLCGPPPVAQALAAACKLHSGDRKERKGKSSSELHEARTIFTFHKENF